MPGVDGLRLLELIEEHRQAVDAKIWNDPDVAPPRPVEEIAADVEQVIRGLLA